MNHQAFEAALAEMKSLSTEMRKLSQASLKKLADIEKTLNR
ncbi:hypothetical protein [Agrobacterium rosae]|nr:hypothetical protein [Agrobacterium rosae]